MGKLKESKDAIKQMYMDDPPRCAQHHWRERVWAYSTTFLEGTGSSGQEETGVTFLYYPNSNKIQYRQIVKHFLLFSVSL